MCIYIYIFPHIALIKYPLLWWYKCGVRWARTRFEDYNLFCGRRANDLRVVYMHCCVCVLSLKWMGKVNNAFSVSVSLSHGMSSSIQFLSMAQGTLQLRVELSFRHQTHNKKRKCCWNVHTVHSLHRSIRPFSPPPVARKFDTTIKWSHLATSATQSLDVQYTYSHIHFTQTTTTTNWQTCTKAFYALLPQYSFISGKHENMLKTISMDEKQSGRRRA